MPPVQSVVLGSLGALATLDLGLYWLGDTRAQPMELVIAPVESSTNYTCLVIPSPCPACLSCETSQSTAPSDRTSWDALRQGFAGLIPWGVWALNRLRQLVQGPRQRRPREPSHPPPQLGAPPVDSTSEMEEDLFDARDAELQAARSRARALRS